MRVWLCGCHVAWDVPFWPVIISKTVFVCLFVCFYLIRKLRDAELENLVLQNPISRRQRMQRLGLTATLGTSGRISNESNGVLLPSVNLISQNDLVGSPRKLGAGRFGTCYSQWLSHYQVCVKVFNKHVDRRSLCCEANILSKFTSEYFPYLFGVVMGSSNPAIVTSFHGFKNISVTLHHALFTQPTLLPESAFDLKLIIRQVICGMEELHTKYKVLHNDIKSDNIVLSQKGEHVVHAVIVDFGKACDIEGGKMYRLSLREREVYITDHPQVAPDLRDGKCKQSIASDVYSFGRVLYRIYLTKRIQGWSFLKDLVKRCMAYDSTARPSTSDIKHMLQ